jgi:DNA-directed RNA polymerase subunit RPC12/RpoP
MKAYCVKCRKKVEMKKPHVELMKNKRPATRGECPECGTRIFKMGAP